MTELIVDSVTNTSTGSIVDLMADCLQGLRVVDLTRNLPGPFATRLLADLGAEIIKIEPKNGDPARAFGELFKALNHGKTTENGWEIVCERRT